jgi:hypothetical protein
MLMRTDRALLPGIFPRDETAASFSPLPGVRCKIRPPPTSAAACDIESGAHAGEAWEEIDKIFPSRHLARRYLACGRRNRIAETRGVPTM